MASPKQTTLPDIAIVGAGTLATALAVALHGQGFRIREIVGRNRPQSLRRAQALARRVGARAVGQNAGFSARIVWICVSDDAIAEVAEHISGRGDWRGKIAVHSSGALASDVLDPLREKGAAVASVHPLMTFVSTHSPSLKDVPFAMEGDRKALSVIGAIVRTLGGKPFRIASDLKSAYHAFGFFSSPALVALVAAAQQVGQLAGLSEKQSRELMQPIVRQTIANCFNSDPQSAFSGPLRRGDVATVRKHLEVLKQTPEALDVYKSLARIALKQLPTANLEDLRKLFTEK